MFTIYGSLGQHECLVWHSTFSSRILLKKTFTLNSKSVWFGCIESTWQYVSVRRRKHRLGNNNRFVDLDTSAEHRLFNVCHTIRGLGCQKQFYQARISNHIPQYSIGCNYLTLPEIPASGTKVLVCRVYPIEYRHGFYGALFCINGSTVYVDSITVAS